MVEIRSTKTLKSNLVDVEDARLAENVDVLNGQLGSI
jgi:hypothetical protein